MTKSALVCDTSVLLYLGRVQHVNMLHALFSPVLVPEPVVFELDVGRTLRTDTLDPRSFDWLTVIAVEPVWHDRLPSNRLGSGEQAVIACAHANPGSWAALDDYQARLLAQQLGIKVVGTIGIFIRAKRAGLISRVQPLLDALHQAGFHLSEEVYQEALRLTDETEGAK